MTAILKVDTIQDTSGNNIINENAGTVTIGKAGNTTNIVGTLQNDGAALIGGIENITTFRMTTNFTLASGTNQINTNWSQAGASLGSLVTESSGTFSFPQTGIYMIAVNFALYRIQSSSAYIGLRIYTTNDNSTYDFNTITYTHIGDVADQHSSLYNEFIFDVTDISNDKIKIYYENQNASNIRLIGNSGREQTYVRFIRLGDT